MRSLIQFLQKYILSTILILFIVFAFYTFHTRDSWISEISDFSTKTIKIYTLDRNEFQSQGYGTSDLESYRSNFIDELCVALAKENIDVAMVRALGANSVSVTITAGYQSREVRSVEEIVQLVIPKSFVLSQSQFLDSSLASKHLIRLLQLLGWGMFFMLLFLTIFYLYHFSMLFSFFICLVLIMMAVFLMGIFKLGVRLDYYNLIGFICLVGIAVDNLILIFEEAISYIGKKRLAVANDLHRAWISQRSVIVMANITTVLVLAPMLIMIFDPAIQAILWMIVLGILTSFLITVSFIKLFYASDKSSAFWYEKQSLKLHWLQFLREKLEFGIGKILKTKFLWVPILLVFLVALFQMNKLSLFNEGAWRKYSGLDLVGGWNAVMKPIEVEEETGNYRPLNSQKLNPIEVKKVLSLVCWKQFKSECTISSGYALDDDAKSKENRIYIIEGQMNRADEAEANEFEEEGEPLGLKEELFDDRFVERIFEYSGNFSFIPGDGVTSIGPRMTMENIQNIKYSLVWSCILLLGCILVFLGMMNRTYTLPQRFGVGLAVMAALFIDMVILLCILISVGIQLKFTTIAALLTVMGYSINDSLVIVGHEGKLERLGMRILLTSLSTAIMAFLLWQGSVSLGVLISEQAGGQLDSVIGSVGREIGQIVFTGVFIGTATSVGIVAPLAQVLLHRDLDQGDSEASSNKEAVGSNLANS